MSAPVPVSAWLVSCPRLWLLGVRQHRSSAGWLCLGIQSSFHRHPAPLFCEHRDQAIEWLLNPQWQGPIKRRFFSISFNDFYYQPPFSLRFGNNNNRGMQCSAFSYLMLPFPFSFFFFNEFLFAPIGCWNKHKTVQDSSYCSGRFNVHTE